VKENKFILKMVVLGDVGVGKSNIIRRIMNQDFQELEATVGVEFTYVDVNDVDHGHSEHQMCTVKDGTACLCYRRVMSHNVSPLVIDSVYRPGRTYYVYGVGKFNCGSNKHGNNPTYEDCILVLFDGHFIWVQKDLICECSFCWNENPQCEETMKLSNILEGIKREKCDFFPSFEHLNASFHSYPAPLIPYDKEVKKCKFCEVDLKEYNIGPGNDICNNEECNQSYIISCKKILPCGHKCFGVNGEITCPPCLVRECKQFGGLFDQDKDVLCSICYTKKLINSPIIVTSCGHYIHYQCIKERLEKKMERS